MLIAAPVANAGAVVVIPNPTNILVHAVDATFVSVIEKSKLKIIDSFLSFHCWDWLDHLNQGN